MDDTELIKSRINIVDLLSEYLQLKKAGANFKALCPFHQERTPSFMVSPERGIWHCFGCGKGGDHFKFLMEREGMDFVDALELLAQKAGVVLKKGERGKGKRESDRLYELNQKAQKLYQHLLLKHPLGKKALEYLTKRGLKIQTIEQFGLGYAPQGWELATNFLLKRGFGQDELISSGLCVPSKQGCYDRFRDRIIFPLVDIRGRVLGFSGRVLDQKKPAFDDPKYINTPQTIIFDKGKFLFGLNLTKGEIRQNKEAILVEGEMDMILSFQAGVKNIVASKGTALTADQVELLRKHTDSILLCFDTDLAGDMACRRGIEMADKKGLNIKVIQIFGGKDPGEVAYKKPKEWAKMVSSSIPIYDYYLDSASKRFGTKSALGKKSLYKELIPILAKISDPIVKEHYIQKLAAAVQVKEQLLRNEMSKNPRDRFVQIQEEKVFEKPTRDRRVVLEEYLISLLLHIPKDHIYVPSFPETLLVQEQLKQIYVLLTLYLDSISFKAKSFEISKFVKQLDKGLQEIVDRLYLSNTSDKLEDRKLWQKEVDKVVGELKKSLIKASLEKLSLAIRNAQEFDRMDLLPNLNKKFRDLSLKLKNL